MTSHSSVMYIAKRVLDVLLSIVMLVALLPAMIVFAILVKLDSYGPVFYSQVRVGQNQRGRKLSRGGLYSKDERSQGSENLSVIYDGADRRRKDYMGKPFPVLKFRTMVVDAETNGPKWCAPQDRRITRIGRLLRATHLDELPQLINILRGDMSFVGPRPERPEFVADLSKKIPAYKSRLSARPGLTGLAQIRHRADVVLDDVRRKIRYDRLYIKKASILTDLKIIFGTIPYMLGAGKYMSARKSVGSPSSAKEKEKVKAGDTSASDIEVHLVGLLLLVMFFSGCYRTKVKPLPVLPEDTRTMTNIDVVPEVTEAPAPSEEAKQKLGKRVSALIMKSEMRLGPEDIIDIRVKDHPELTAQVNVDPWGFVKLPYVESLQVNGLTESMVEDILTKKYAEFFRQPPEVHVTVVQYLSQGVYVLGAVARPGRYPLIKGKPMTLRDVTVEAGLPLDSAALWRTWVFRQQDAGGRPSKRHINLGKILYRGQLDHNVTLQSGDIVYVPYTVIDTFVNFLGRITRPITGAARRVVGAGTTGTTN